MGSVLQAAAENIKNWLCSTMLGEELMENPNIL